MYFIKDSTNGSLAATMQITKHSKRKPEGFENIPIINNDGCYSRILTIYCLMMIIDLIGSVSFVYNAEWLSRYGYVLITGNPCYWFSNIGFLSSIIQDNSSCRDSTNQLQTSRYNLHWSFLSLVYSHRYVS